MGFQVLGPVRIVRDDGVSPALGVLQRRLLAMLLSRAGQAVPATVLFEAMWPDEPWSVPSGRLHVHVTRLRRAMDDPDRLAFEPGGYRLRTHGIDIDAARFEKLVDQAQGEAAPLTRASLARQALALWRGEAYADVDGDIVDDEACRLAGRRESALELLYEAELLAGRHAEIADELADAANLYPLRERLCGQSMTALYLSGRQAEALAVFRRTRRHLIDELGLEPGPELRVIEQRILAGGDLVEEDRVERPAPRQLPHVVTDFVGRAAELSEVDTAVAAAPIVLLSGTGGVGKTALATYWAHQALDRFPDGQLYVDLRGYGPDEPLQAGDVLATFLHQLGVPGNQIPQEPAERAARFRSECAGRRLLVVLDNARTVAQVRPLLPGTPSCSVLVTSRDALAGLAVRDGAHRVELGPLSSGDSTALMRRLVLDRAGAEPAATDLLIDRCARLPLALRIVAELIRTRRGMRLDELVAELSDARRGLDMFDVDGDTGSSVRAVFSWSYHSLPAGAARLFRLSGLHPGADTDLHALAALTGADLHTTRRDVDVLVRAYLLERSPDGRFRAHDLLRAYAAELVATTDSVADNELAVARLDAHYLDAAAAAVDMVEPQEVLRRPRPKPSESPRPTLLSRSDALSWLDAERPNLVALGVHAQRRSRPRVTIDLALILARYLQNSHLDEALALFHAARNAALGDRDELAEAHVTRMLAATYARMGKVDLALEHGNRSYARYRDLGEPLLAVIPLITISSTHTQAGRYPAALSAIEEGIEMIAGLDDVPAVLQAHAQARIGDVLTHLGRYDEARAHLNTALELATELENPFIQSLVHLMLGQTAHWSGDDVLARQHLEHSRSLSVELGNRIGEAQLHSLAMVYWRLGMRTDAFAWAWRCVAVAREAGFRLEAAEPLLVLGELYRCDGAFRDAIDHYREALGIAEDIDNHHQRARALTGLGDTFAAMGEPDTATAYWKQAHDIFDGLDGKPTELTEKLP